MIRPGRLDVELLYHRKALKKWVTCRLAATPDATGESMEATAWFHDLAVEERSRLITDLARLSLKSVDLKSIAAGPLGVLFSRFSNVFAPGQTFEEPLEPVADASSNVVEDESESDAKLEYAVPNWFSSWKEFEPGIEGSVWPGM